MNIYPELPSSVEILDKILTEVIHDGGSITFESFNQSANRWIFKVNGQKLTTINEDEAAMILGHTNVDLDLIARKRH